jgi:uncharacterized protein YbjT (DUF2867 family)
MILVTGATGIAGAHVVRALLDRGEAVRAFVRDPGRAEPSGADIAVGDLGDAGSVRAALDGVDVLILSCADDPRRIGWEAGAIAAAADAGVRRIVRLSSIGAAPGAPVVFWDWHGRADAQLRAADVPSAIVHAHPYMSNVFMGLADGTAPVAMIDPRDVGAAVAAVAAQPGRDSAAHTISGPEAITYAQAAEALGIEPGGDPLPEPVEQLLAALRGGAAAEPTRGVELLTGRVPNDIATFARDHAGALR